MNDILNTDVLVIGAGNAGLRAAIEAAREGAKVIIANKSMFPGGSSCISGGNMQASFGWVPGETKDVHFKDTVISSKYLCDQKLVRILVEEAPDRLFDIEDWGAFYTRAEPNRYKQTIGAGGLSAPRTLEVGGLFVDVVKTLYETAIGYGAKVYDQVMVTSLLKSPDGAITGATAIDITTGNFLVFQAKSTILANGPSGRMFSVTANARSSTGDGFGMAYRAGATLVNMEFVLFLPLGFIYPDFVKGVSLGEMSNYGKNTMAFNSRGERYMAKYAPETMERSTRDICSRAAYIEIAEGRGTPAGGILVDNSKNDPALSILNPSQVPKFYRKVKEYLGEDVASLKKPIEAAPTTLFMLGGVKINEKCEASLPGLYAAGEVEANVHGANRLGGNAVAEGQVFGRRAGHYAAERAKGIELTEFPEDSIAEERERIFSFFNHHDGIRPVHIKKQIQKLMWDKVSIVRNEKALKEAVSEIDNLKEKLPQISLMSNALRYNYEWVEAIEVNNMVHVAEMIARSALARQESRGAHYRSDFPQVDNKNWLKESVVKNVNGKMNLSTGPVNITEMHPPEEQNIK